MEEKDMPAAEAEGVVDTAEEVEAIHYELAFHVLPTVADGEVEKVQHDLRAEIEKVGGTFDTEEAAARFDLAYPISIRVDGKHKTFATSHLGWIRFMLIGSELDALKEELDVRTDLLRYMIIKLTKEEAAQPFKVHEVVSKMPETIGDDPDAPVIEAKHEDEKEEGEVEEQELDKSLDKIVA